MKNKISVLLLGAVFFVSCAQKETKTLYGSWEPIVQCADSSDVWVPTDRNFLISVSGKCEEILVEKTERGDLTNPDIPMPDAKCYGDRDQLSFTDNYGPSAVYELKMDATRDTLIGTVTTVWSNLPAPVVEKIKFLRIQ